MGSGVCGLGGADAEQCRSSLGGCTLVAPPVLPCDLYEATNPLHGLGRLLFGAATTEVKNADGAHVGAERGALCVSESFLFLKFRLAVHFRREGGGRVRVIES